MAASEIPQQKTCGVCNPSKKDATTNCIDKKTTPSTLSFKCQWPLGNLLYFVCLNVNWWWLLKKYWLESIKSYKSKNNKLLVDVGNHLKHVIQSYCGFEFNLDL